MAKIEFSSELKKNILEKMFTDVSPSITSFQSGKLKIFSTPVDPDISNITSVDYNSDNLLLEMTPLSSSIDEDGKINLTFDFHPAIKNGTPQSFWMYHTKSVDTGEVDVDGNPILNEEIVNQITGTVGTSNSDIVFPVSTFNQGSNYRILNISFDIPSTFEY